MGSPSKIAANLQWTAPRRCPVQTVQCIGAAPQNTWNGKFGALDSPSKYQCLCQYWPENSEPRALGVPSSFLVQGSVLPSRSAVRCIGQPLIPVHWTTPHLSWCRGQYCPRDLRSCALGSPLLCIEQVPQPLQMGQAEHRQLKIFIARVL